MWSRISAELTGFKELTLCLDTTGARRPLQTRIRTAVTEDGRRAERTNTLNELSLKSAAKLRSLTGDKRPEI